MHGSLPIPQDDLTHTETQRLEELVLERLSLPPSHEDEARRADVEARLRCGLGQTEVCQN
jgi:hypothetical protein